MTHKQLNLRLMTAGFAFLLFSMMNNSFGQQSPVQIVNTLYRQYDTSRHMAFDFNISLVQDSVFGSRNSESMNGSMKLAGQKGFFKLEKTSITQTDSALIAVYEDEGVIILQKREFEFSETYFPIKNQVDSFLFGKISSYSITSFPDSTDAGTSVIRFARADSLALFDWVEIRYTPSDTLFREITYQHKVVVPVISEAPSATLGETETVFVERQITQVLRMEFYNYRFNETDDKLYDLENYVWWSGSLWMPAERYAGYAVYDSR